MSPAADVYQGDRRVAHLDRTQRGVVLEYLPGIQLDHGYLSTRLPYSPDPIESDDLPRFFLNLLPEGARLQLLLESQRAKDDALGLLLRIGWDTIGDVAVVPHGETFKTHENSIPFTDLGEASFWKLFQDGVSSRPDASIPGVQEKISSSTVAFGIRTEHTPSAILKLNPKRFPRLVHNEEFFLRMARACGVECNRAELVHDRGGEPGLLVSRFDRVKEGKTIRKLHQEDACQLLDLVPGHKYSTTLRQIADAVSKTVSAPVVEILRLLQLYAFSYLIGNADLHAKNISLLWEKVIRLSPAYDLLSTLPYPHDREMALKLDGRDDNFRMGYFVSFGLRYGVPERATTSMIQNLCSKAKPWIGRLGEIGFDSQTTERLSKEIGTRLSRLQR